MHSKAMFSISQAGFRARDDEPASLAVSLKEGLRSPEMQLE